MKMASTVVSRLGSLAIGLGVLSSIAFMTGWFVPTLMDTLLHQGILDHVVWRPDSPPDVDARYRGIPDPAGEPDYFRVWMWNLTNLADVRRGAKPKMEEVGPLTYYKYRVKLDAKWDRTGRVSVKEWDYHVYQPHLSAASPTDPVTTLNLPLLGVLETLHAASTAVPAVRPLIDVLVGVLSGWRDEHVDGLFTRRTAGELIWGYEDLLLQRLSLLLGRTFVRSSTVRLVPNETAAEVMANQVPNVIDTGWRPAGSAGHHQYNEGAGGAGAGAGGASGRTAAAAPSGRRGGGRLRLPYPSPYQVYDEQNIWNMEVEGGWTNVTSWGPNCTEQVRGTDAFQFSPGLTPQSKPRVWITDLFRSAELNFLGETDLHGIRLLRFLPDPRETDPDPCHHQRIRGLANVTVPLAVGPNGNGSSDAAHGVPLLISLPHYCLVDESVTSALEGPRCDLEAHGLYLDIEPNTGTTMRAAKRLQLSSQLTDSARTTLEPSIGSPLILPVFWAEEASQISAVQAAGFRRRVYGVQRTAAALRTWSYPVAAALAALAAAAGGVVVAAALAARSRSRSRAAPAAAAGRGSGSGSGSGGEHEAFGPLTRWGSGESGGSAGSPRGGPEGLLAAGAEGGGFSDGTTFGRPHPHPHPHPHAGEDRGGDACGASEGEAKKGGEEGMGPSGLAPEGSAGAAAAAAAANVRGREREGQTEGRGRGGGGGGGGGGSDDGLRTPLLEAAAESYGGGH